MMFQKLSDKPIADFQNEQAEKWEDINLLGRTAKGRDGAPLFVFYEGPPTANGKPGIHHVMARTLKDSINRHKSMEGYRVPRKAGWDTHGLPVEIEVEKQLEIFTKKEIEEYGIGAFNDKCRESVFKYEGMWREMSRRMGFLIDMQNPYITLDNNYIETGWHILKRFYDEGLIYEGHKILPYCPRCGTGLASHEVSLGYKEVKTNTVVAMFKSKEQSEAYYLAWTTTPWTLPSNVSLTVGPDIDYVKAKTEDGRFFYLAASLADKILGADSYEVVEQFKGSELEGREYEQLMPFVNVADEFPRNKAFYVTVNDYVGADDGTGIVHTAPAFGEDDYNTGRKYGLPVPNPVDEEGKFTATPWKGHPVMEEGLDVEIIKWLASEGKLFSKEKVEHNYPFCWRCDTPLIYYSKPSWYIEMTKLKDELVAANKQVNWYPDFVGEKRFGNWLENLNDWAISRSRYWGTPIPIWRCDDCGEIICIGSREELASKSIQDIPLDAEGKPDIELHRPHVDNITIKCEKCGSQMHRIPEVMDCWFDSGAMPYAQRHWPFENEDNFDEEFFPADFICEGIDQTRGWFYSLLAISTFLKGRAPYKNVLVNDLIWDKDGKKMSKSRGNTVDPFDQFDKFGADATRWYLLYTSPAWSPTKYDEDGVKEISGKFFGTLRNVYHFFVLYAEQDGIDPRDYELKHEDRPELDRWILSKYNRLIQEVIADMDNYDHMKAVRKIQYFVEEELSNWFIRRARRRFWAAELTDDKKSVYSATYEILTGVCRLAAPMAPFLTDEIYTKLAGAESVHLELYPTAQPSYIDDKLEERMQLVQRIVGLGRGVREKERLKVRQPLSEALLDGKNEELIGDMTELIKEELNLKEVVFLKDPAEYMNYSLKPNFRAAGPILGSRMKTFAGVIASQDAASFVSQVEKEGSVLVEMPDGDSVSVTLELLDINITAKEGFAVAMEEGVFIILDTVLSDELISEGISREFISKVQQIRKQIGLEMMDRIEVFFDGDNEVQAVVTKHKDHIMSEVLANKLEIRSDGEVEAYDLNGHSTAIKVAKVI
jgi:isoleucyl-tRNA synthetase